MKNKFNIPIEIRNFNKYSVCRSHNCIDKYTTRLGTLDYTRNINTNFSILYFGFRLRIKRK